LVYLFIQWENLDAHWINFRQSQNFIEWRKLLEEFFAADPNVRHVEVIPGFVASENDRLSSGL
jgi:hypothetical protein